MITTINGILTGLLIVLFLGIWIWAWSSRNTGKFSALSQLPLEDEHHHKEDDEQRGKGHE